MKTWVEIASLLSGTVLNCASSIQALVTVVAISVGGLWTYRLFIQGREQFPRAALAHHITERGLPANRRLLHVVTTITNTGGVLLSLNTGRIWVQQVLPVPGHIADQLQRNIDLVKQGETEIEWPCIGLRETDLSEEPCEIEPGETDHLHFDFVVESEVRTVKIYSYFENVRRRDRPIGWTVSTFHDMGSIDGGQP